MAEYKNGAVFWHTYIRTVAGKQDAYLADLEKHWKPVMEAAKSEGVIASYHVFLSLPANSQDWDVVTTVELRSMAALDNIKPQIDAIIASLLSDGGTIERADKRLHLRELLGEKITREIYL